MAGAALLAETRQETVSREKKGTRSILEGQGCCGGPSENRVQSRGGILGGGEGGRRVRGAI